MLLDYVSPDARQQSSVGTVTSYTKYFGNTENSPYFPIRVGVFLDTHSENGLLGVASVLQAAVPVILEACRGLFQGKPNWETRANAYKITAVSTGH